MEAAGEVVVAVSVEDSAEAAVVTLVAVAEEAAGDSHIEQESYMLAQ